MQIERKFLFDEVSFSAYFTQNSTKFQNDTIHKFYISLNPEICYIKSYDGYFLSHKKENLQIFNISKDEFKIAKQDKIASTLKYDIFKFQGDGFLAEFKIYKGELSGICLAKMIFEDENLAHRFDTNAYFSGVKFSEVSSFSEFNEPNLAFLGSPFGKFDTKKAKEILGKNKNLSFTIPSYLDSFDCVVFILSLIFDNIKRFKDEFLNDKNGDALHQFRVSLRKFRAILKQSKELFEPNLANHILEILKIIANKTNQKRDLEIFHQKLSFLNTPNLLLQTLEDREKKSSDELEKFFKSQNFDSFLQSMEIFLGDQNRRFGTTDYEKISKKFIAILLLKDMRKLKLSLENLNESSPNSDFHIVRIKIKNLRYALESFGFDKKSLISFTNGLKLFQDIFGNLQDIDSWQNFIGIYKNSVTDENEISRFLCSFERLISGHSTNIREKILEKKAKFVKVLNKHIKFLKIYKEI